MMRKIESDFIIRQYQSGIKSYSDFSREVGLWDSEAYVFEKYLKTSYQILDLGCGTGRTTFPLYKMGFQNIIGVDLTPEMIEEAKKLNSYFDTQIDFKTGDATGLTLEDGYFDIVIFSFNGLMSIPGKENRDAALKEINRVLKKEGLFIFTTHDRDREPQFYEFWKEEKKKWQKGEQNQRLYEFGDIITKSKNESREIFIHIPDQEEIKTWTSMHGFDLVETFYRSDKFEEKEAVKVKSGECRFWVLKKQSHQ